MVNTHRNAGHANTNAANPSEPRTVHYWKNGSDSRGEKPTRTVAIQHPAGDKPKAGNRKPVLNGLGSGERGHPGLTDSEFHI